MDFEIAFVDDPFDGSRIHRFHRVDIKVDLLFIIRHSDVVKTFGNHSHLKFRESIKSIPRVGIHEAMGRCEDVPVANQSPATANIFIIKYNVSLSPILKYKRE
jgi:hypothetical protein